MRKICFLLFMAFTIHVSGQENIANQKPLVDEIIGFKLYPNPVYSNVVNITTKNNGTKQIVIYDVFGKIVQKDRIFNQILDISKLVPGIYVIQVTEDKKTIRRKLVVK